MISSFLVDFIIFLNLESCFIKFVSFISFHSLLFSCFNFILKVITKEQFEDALKELQDEGIIVAMGKSTIRIC